MAVKRTCINLEIKTLAQAFSTHALHYKSETALLNQNNLVGNLGWTRVYSSPKKTKQNHVILKNSQVNKNSKEM